MTSTDRPTGEAMQTQEISSAKLTTVAVFPRSSFLENLAVRADGSILVTEILHNGRKTL
jgi:hypothetical protein